MPARSNDHTMWHADRHATGRNATDGGYTLIAPVMAVLMLGILIGGADFAVGGMTSEAADIGCRADQRQRILVEGGLLGSVSEIHAADSEDGAVTPQEGSSC